MKKTFIKWGVLGLTLALCAGLAGCSAERTTQNDIPPNTQTQENQQTAPAPAERKVTGLAAGFPAAIPFYEGASVVESDNFNGNNYTVVYTVTATFTDVLDYYLGVFALDESGVEDGLAYYEAFDFGDVFVKGLTIEDTGDGTTVFMTLEDTRQTSGSDEDSGDSAGSASLTAE